MRTLTRRILAMALLALTISAFADMDVTKYIPADTKILLRVDVAAAMQTDLLADVLRQQAGHGYGWSARGHSVPTQSDTSSETCRTSSKNAVRAASSCASIS